MKPEKTQSLIQTKHPVVQFHSDQSTILQDVSFVELVGTDFKQRVSDVLTAADVDKMCSGTHTYVCSLEKQHQMTYRETETLVLDCQLVNELSLAVKERKMTQHNT